MSHAFSDIGFTASVKEVQTQFGSREANQRLAQRENAQQELTEAEALFIAERDSFYQASVSESGWPYVQHRGGPAGFLKVLNSKTIGYADFRGNRQYISVGNFSYDNRVSLILMDYTHRQRLKLWGRVEIIDAVNAPDTVAQLEVTAYRGRVERGIIIHIDAFDWNCPQHITPRFTEAEIAVYTQSLHEEIAALTNELALLKGSQR